MIEVNYMKSNGLGEVEACTGQTFPSIEKFFAWLSIQSQNGWTVTIALLRQHS